MRDALKIAPGIFLGVLAVALCAVCLFFASTLGGLAILGSLLPTEEAGSYMGPFPSATQATSSPPPGPVGHIAECHDLGLTPISHEASATCPGGYGRPAPGAKFLVVYFSATNFTDQVIALPSISFRLDQYEAGLGSIGDCLYDNQSFSIACLHSSGKLFPGVTCEGWELFEVPLSFDGASASLHASVNDYETALACEAQWPLVPPE